MTKLNSCTNSLPLNDLDILMALDHQATPEIVSHLAECDACRERGEELRRLQSRLTSALYRSTCPTSLELGEYHLGLLESSAQRLIDEHLHACLHCMAELMTLRGEMSRPEPVVQSGVSRTLRSSAQMVLAQLVSGALGIVSGPQATPSYSSLRGDEDPMMIYQTMDAQISIEVQPDSSHIGQHVIYGLVTGGALNAGEVTAELWHQGQPIHTTQIDEIGNFSFEGLAAGDYELFVIGNLVEIHAPCLQVGKPL